MNNRSNCRTCGTEIIWIRTAKNDKRMPVDAEPARQLKVGEFYFDLNGRAYKIKPDDAHEKVLYTSHFSTCPSRKPRRKME